MDEATARAFGRIESTLDRISTQQVEVLTTLARHDERLIRAEGRIDELETARTTSHHQGVSFRAALTVGMCTVIASNVGALVLGLAVK